MEETAVYRAAILFFCRRKMFSGAQSFHCAGWIPLRAHTELTTRNWYVTPSKLSRAVFETTNDLFLSLGWLHLRLHFNLSKSGSWFLVILSTATCPWSWEQSFGGMLWMRTANSHWVASLSSCDSQFTLLAQASYLIQTVALFVKYQLRVSYHVIES